MICGALNFVLPCHLSSLLLCDFRWYLSSFHAGRKSTIAKKPYNPILGETFRCHWNVPGMESGPPVTDGPLPWCGSNDLVFVAEQVSHHPPVSAFYAEHVGKRVAVNAHIYTKSSFLGMSVGGIGHFNAGIGRRLKFQTCFRWRCTILDKAAFISWTMTKNTS